eukprot:CAMPEP_0178423564 /NCGR_PEP_ID=MMETSP0689_2-20121128/27753_1 /TAXON_ID=160604 /ORGANISM="Amphidinium massartii, Strain CS-259" /LENGTH=128 /DNA_ID=CAMNT_0020045161 /DNA_START=217 /DNA_END=603 /DNA_ORIENTATION=+
MHRSAGSSCLAMQLLEEILAGLGCSVFILVAAHGLSSKSISNSCPEARSRLDSSRLPISWQGDGDDGDKLKDPEPRSEGQLVVVLLVTSPSSSLPGVFCDGSSRNDNVASREAMTELGVVVALRDAVS